MKTKIKYDKKRDSESRLCSPRPEEVFQMGIELQHAWVLQSNLKPVIVSVSETLLPERPSHVIQDTLIYFPCRIKR